MVLWALTTTWLIHIPADRCAQASSLSSICLGSSLFSRRQTAETFWSKTCHFWTHQHQLDENLLPRQPNNLQKEKGENGASMRRNKKLSYWFASGAPPAAAFFRMAVDVPESLGRACAWTSGPGSHCVRGEKSSRNGSQRAQKGGETCVSSYEFR